MSLFWKIADALEPDGKQAQIIVGLPRKFTSGGPEGEPNELSVRDLSKLLQTDDESEAVLVISADREKCQEIVVRLSVLGVQQLHAVHPK